ncbi:MAG: rnk [Myxococcales bacterium]|nr:rnk [Myxococcales bacterium]
MNASANVHDLIITDEDLRRLLPVLNTYDSPASEQLEGELQRATVVEQRSAPPDVVTMNSEVVYEDHTSGTRRTVRVVYPRDADASRGWISVLAPIGSALLGLRVGPSIAWQLPSGPRRISVIELRYQPEASGELHL